MANRCKPIRGSRLICREQVQLLDVEQITDYLFTICSMAVRLASVLNSVLDAGLAIMSKADPLELSFRVHDAQSCNPH